MIQLKNAKEIDILRKANHIVWEVLLRLEEIAAPGVTTLDLDRIADELVRKKGAKPAFKGLYGFPNALCASTNEAVVHGIPNKRPLEEGDVVGLDFGSIVEGLYGDGAMTIGIGRIDPETERLLRVTRESLGKGVEQMRVGNRISDISHAIQAHVEAAGFSVVRSYVGHGIGYKPHEEPQVPNFGPPGKGYRMREGLVLALEPMVNQGGYEVKTLGDEWTVVTADGSLSAHFENSVAVTASGPLILNYDA